MSALFGLTEVIFLEKYANISKLSLLSPSQENPEEH